MITLTTGRVRVVVAVFTWMRLGDQAEGTLSRRGELVCQQEVMLEAA